MPGHYNPDEFSQIHKTLSKSFVMQRKTLVRVLGLEGRVSELESQQAAEEQAKEGIDEILNDIHEAKEEVGGTKTKTKPKAKAKPKVKPKAKKTRVKGKRIRKPKIDADKFKRGTSQETVEERLKRQARNRQETAAAEEHQKTDEFTETTTGTDPKTGEPLSSEERKRRFKAAKFVNKTGLDPQDIKPETEAEMGDSKKDNVIEFLNGDVKDNLDDVRDDLKQIEGLLKDQNKSADDQYEEMRQGILAAKKKKREEKLEDKDKKPGSGLKDKMLDMVTKPAGNFFNKIIKFITFTFLGSVVNRILGILKDPAQLLDPIKKFFNAIIGMVNVVLKVLWDITGAPINFIIGGINNGVKFIIDSINSVSSKLALPPIPEFSIPLIPGPPEVPEIPLSKTAQAQNEGAVGMSGGGVVPGPMGAQGDMGLAGADGIPGPMGAQGDMGLAGADGIPGVDGLQGLLGFPDIGGTIKKPTLTMSDGIELPGLGGGGGGTNAITAKAMTKSLGTRTKDIGNLFARPFRKKEDRDPLTQFASGMPNLGGGGGGTNAITEKSKRKTNIFSNFTPTEQDLSQELNGGGIVQNLNVRRQGFGGGGYAAPYPTTNLLGMGHNVIDTAPGNIMGYNKGGKVPGSGEGDTVPAMLTPGEFVMSKGAVDKIGADNLMAMNKAGGGTNQPKLMKFAGGGIVPGIDAPTKRKGKVTIIRSGGNKSSSPRYGSGGSEDKTPKFSSTDPNNMTTPVVKSLYNMIG